MTRDASRYFGDMVTLKEIAEDAEQLRRKQGWPRKSAQQRFLFLVAEVGELAESISALENAKGEPRHRLETLLAEVGAEMYDVIWNVCDLAAILGIDLDAAASTKRALNRTRDW